MRYFVIALLLLTACSAPEVIPEPTVPVQEPDVVPGTNEPVLRPPFDCTEYRYIWQYEDGEPTVLEKVCAGACPKDYWEVPGEEGIVCTKN